MRPFYAFRNAAALVCLCCASCGYAFDVAAYHDPISWPRFFAHWGWISHTESGYQAYDCNLCGDGCWPATPEVEARWISAITNEDTVLRWWEEMGVTKLQVWWKPEDYARLSNVQHLQVLNNMWPNQTFKYVEAIMKGTRVAYHEAPYWWTDTDWAANDTNLSVYPAEPNQDVLYLSPSDGPGPFFLPYPGGGNFGKWSGWQGRGSWSEADAVMPMHFRLTQRIDYTPGDTTEQVATFYWIVQESFDPVRYVRYPGIPIRRSDLGQSGVFLSHEYPFVPSDGSGHFDLLDAGFQRISDYGNPNGPHMFQRSIGGEGAYTVSFQIDYTGNHTYYLYSVEAWDEGYHRLYMHSDPDSITYYRNLVASSFATDYSLGAGKHAGWYIDEPDYRLLPAYVRVNKIMQSQGLPTFTMNGLGHSFRNNGQMDSLFYIADTAGVDVPVQMSEFDWEGGDTTWNPNMGWGVPVFWMSTDPSSDAPYILLTDSSDQEADGAPLIENGPCGNVVRRQMLYKGTKSIQAALDMSIWDIRTLWTMSGTQAYPYCWIDSFDYRHSLTEQIQFAHSHQTKEWALIAGGPDGTNNPDNCCPIRTPTPNEIKLTSWIVVACDADGLMWYNGLSVPRSDENQSYWGGLLEWGTSEENQEFGSFCLPNSRSVYRTDRFFAAKDACTKIHQIAPIIEPLQFVGTTASRIYETNYTALTDSLKLSELRQWTTEIGQEQYTYSSQVADIRSKYHYDGNWYWDTNAYAQVSAWREPNLRSDDFWFLVVNRRALSSERRRIFVELDYLESGAEYYVRRVLQENVTLADTLDGQGSGEGTQYRGFWVELGPGDAELVHFSPDTSDLIIDGYQNDTLYTPLMLTRNIRIRQGTLTILPGEDDTTGTVLFWPGKGIYLDEGDQSSPEDNGLLRITGNDSVTIHMDAMLKGQKWEGIQLNEGTADTILLRQVEFKNARTGLFVESYALGEWHVESHVTVDACTFDSCDVAVALANRAKVVIDSSSIDRNRNGIRCLTGCDLAVSHSTINSNQILALSLTSNCNAELEDVDIENNGIAAGNPQMAAVRIVSSSAQFKCCEIDNNECIGIFGSHASLLLADTTVSSIWGHNSVTSNNLGRTSLQIYDTRSNGLALDGGFNRIVGDTAFGLWVYSTMGSCSPNWRQNYWGPYDTTEIRQHLPSGVIFEPRRTSWFNCEGEADDTSGSGGQQLFVTGKKLAKSEQFASARIAFTDVVLSEPECSFAPGAIREVLQTDLLADDPAYSQEVFAEIADTTAIPMLALSAKHAEAWSYGFAGEVDDAYEIFSDILDTASDQSNIVGAKIELLALDLYGQNADSTDFVTTSEVLAAFDSIDALLGSLYHWDQYEIHDSVVMYAPCYVDSTITIYQGAALTILPSPGISRPVVRFTSNASINVVGYFDGRGSLYGRGEADHPVVLHWDSTESWTNIFSMGGNIDLKNTTLEGHGFLGWTENTLHPLTLRVDSCTFDGFGEGIWVLGADTTSYIKNSTLSRMGAWSDYTGMGFGTGLTVFGGDKFSIENCTFENNDGVGLLIGTSGDFEVKNSIIQGSHDYGILVWDAGELSLECTELSLNGDTLPELFVEDGAIDLVDGHNAFADSDGVLVYAGDPSFIDMEDGQNRFELYTESGTYLQSGSPTNIWDITYNNWSPVLPTDQDFYSYLDPTNPAKWTVDSSLADFIACGDGGAMSMNGNLLVVGETPDAGIMSNDDDASKGPVALSKVKAASKGEPKSDQAGKTFDKTKPKTKTSRADYIRLHHAELVKWREFKSLARSDDKVSAIAAGKKLISESSGSPLVPSAMVRLASLARYDNAKSVSVFFDGAQKQLPNRGDRVLARRLSCKAKALEGNPGEAIAGLEELMETAETPQDSVKALVTAMGIYLMNTTDENLQPRHANVRVTDPREFARQVIKLAKVLHDPALAADHGTPEIPSEYMLYQNFPNPFNPNTEIRFDLPEAVQVQLKVFNVLGQEVATLVDAMRPAGAYNVMWDSKTSSGMTVASGVYVYQIKAGQFTDQKKMVLIR